MAPSHYIPTFRINSLKMRSCFFLSPLKWLSRGLGRCVSNSSEPVLLCVKWPRRFFRARASIQTRACLASHNDNKHYDHAHRRGEHPILVSPPQVFRGAVNGRASGRAGKFENRGSPARTLIDELSRKIDHHFTLNSPKYLDWNLAEEKFEEFFPLNYAIWSLGKCLNYWILVFQRGNIFFNCDNTELKRSSKINFLFPNGKRFSFEIKTTWVSMV